MGKHHWRVTVSIDGEEVLAIEPEMLAGISDIEKYQREVWTAAQSLAAFIGDPDAPVTCFLCGGVDKCEPDCPVLEPLAHPDASEREQADG